MFAIVFNVNGQSSLYATGIKDFYTDEEIANVFKVNGKISKIGSSMSQDSQRVEP